MHRRPLSRSVLTFRRMAFGAIALVTLGPLIAGFTVGSVFSVVVCARECGDPYNAFLNWLLFSLFVSRMAFWLGWMPAALIGAGMGALCRVVPRGWFVHGSVWAAMLITFVYCLRVKDVGAISALAAVLSIPPVVLLARYLSRAHCAGNASTEVATVSRPI